MTDLEQRMQELESLPAPDLWRSIEVRSRRRLTLPNRILNRLRLARPLQVLVLATMLGLIGGAGALITNPRVQEIETAGDPGRGKEEAPNAEPIRIQEPEEIPRGAAGAPRPKASPRATGSVTGARAEENRPSAGGSPVFYTDQADDANGQDTPNAALSQREYDILRVDWATVPYVNEQSPGGYSTSMTIAGSAREDGQYVSWAWFGRDCRAYHFLTPGTTAYANVFCDSSTEGGWMGFVGRIEGGPVTATPTASGGTRLTATFDNRALPDELEAAGRNFYNLSAFTCEGHVERIGYCPGNLDGATSTLSFRV